LPKVIRFIKYNKHTC